MDSGLIFMSSIFLGAVVFVVALWWFDQHRAPMRAKVGIVGTIFIALSPWPFAEAVVGLSRGVIDFHLRGHNWVFWRSTDSYEFWLAYGFLVGLGLLALGIGASAVYFAIRREKPEAPSSNFSSSGREVSATGTDRRRST